MNSPLSINQLLRYFRHYHQKDYSFGGHSHMYSEITIVLKGRFEVTYDDTIITLKENTLMIYDEDVFHRNRIISSEDAVVLVYHFKTDDIPPGEKARIYELNESNLNLVNIIAEESDKNAAKLEGASFMAETFNYQAKKLLEILLIRLIEKEPFADFQHHPESEIFNSAVSYMKDNISGNLSIHEIAQHCQTNDTNLKNIFRKHTGNGVIAHFSHMKIAAAKKLIKEGFSIGETSDVLGYSSQAYLTLCFKKETGMTPLEYKKEM